MGVTSSKASSPPEKRCTRVVLELDRRDESEPRRLVVPLSSRKALMVRAAEAFGVGESEVVLTVPSLFDTELEDDSPLHDGDQVRATVIPAAAGQAAAMASSMDASEPLGGKAPNNDTKGAVQAAQQPAAAPPAATALTESACPASIKVYGRDRRVCFVPCRLTDTVAALVFRLQSQTGMLRQSVDAWHGSQHVSSSTLSLRDIGMVDGSVVRTAPSSPGDFMVMVRMPSGRLLCLTVECWDTVMQVKSRIRAHEALHTSRQRLTFRGIELDNHRTLNQQGVEAGATVALLLDAEPVDRASATACSPTDQAGIVLDLTLPDSSRVKVDAELSDTVVALKARVECLTMIPADRQRITSSGRTIERGRTLAECGVGTGSSLEVSLLRNGEMQVFVRLFQSAWSLPLHVMPTDSVADMKELIREAYGAPVADQVLTLDGRALDDGSSLDRAGVTMGTRLELGVESMRGSIRLQLHRLEGRGCEIQAFPWEAVGDLRERVFVQTEADPEEQSLCSDSGELAERRSLSSYGLIHKSRVYLLPKS